MRHLEDALILLEDALREDKSPLVHRLDAAVLALDATIHLQAWLRATTIVEAMVDLLTLLTTRTRYTEDLEHLLRRVSNITSAGASIFLKAGKDATSALTVLEKSQNLIHAVVMKTRTDIPLLEERGPRLWSKRAEVLTSLDAMLISREIASTCVGTKSFNGYATEFLELQQFSNTLDIIQSEIRSINGIQDLEWVPSEDTFRSLASEGPIVCFNITNLGSHAILVTEDRLRYLELSALEEKNIERCIMTAATLRGSTRPFDPKGVLIDGIAKPINQPNMFQTMAEAMEWLWQSTVRPVLDELQLLWQDQAPKKLPCVWWIGGGLMSLLPMHAAGCHDKGSTQNTMSHVVSSYVPSLRALQASRNKRKLSLEHNKDAGQPQVLVVEMPTTPGIQKPLHNTHREMEAIQQHAKEAATIEILSNPSKALTLDKMKNCSIFHAACHATLDRRSSFESGLILGNGSMPEKLSVNDVRSMKFEKAHLAYLSACSTASSSDRAMITENIHLASTFQLEIRHVIGTLWDAHDDAAATVAGKFYKFLFQQGGREPDISQALHNAVSECKHELADPAKISHWGPFVHVGP